MTELDDILAKISPLGMHGAKLKAAKAELAELRSRPKALDVYDKLAALKVRHSTLLPKGWLFIGEGDPALGDFFASQPPGGQRSIAVETDGQISIAPPDVVTAAVERAWGEAFRAGVLPAEGSSRAVDVDIGPPGRSVLVRGELTCTFGNMPKGEIERIRVPICVDGKISTILEPEESERVMDVLLGRWPPSLPREGDLEC